MKWSAVICQRLRSNAGCGVLPGGSSLVSANSFQADETLAPAAASNPEKHSGCPRLFYGCLEKFGILFSALRSFVLVLSFNLDKSHKGINWSRESLSWPYLRRCLTHTWPVRCKLDIAGDKFSGVSRIAVFLVIVRLFGLLAVKSPVSVIMFTGRQVKVTRRGSPN